jgi:hypothetical protein
MDKPIIGVTGAAAHNLNNDNEYFMSGTQYVGG